MANWLSLSERYKVYSLTDFQRANYYFRNEKKKIFAFTRTYSFACDSDRTVLHTHSRRRRRRRKRQHDFQPENGLRRDECANVRARVCVCECVRGLQNDCH